MSLGKGMASPMHAYQLGMRLLVAKCVGAGTSTPTGLEGDAVSLSRTGVGDYEFTFDGEGALDIRDVNVSVRQAATKDVVPFFTYDEAARTVTVTTKNAAGSFAEIDLTSSEELLVSLWVKTTKR